MIARLTCWFLGHKRGKRVTSVASTGTSPVTTFACPRCNATWTRKAKA